MDSSGAHTPRATPHDGSQAGFTNIAEEMDKMKPKQTTYICGECYKQELVNRSTNGRSSIRNKLNN